MAIIRQIVCGDLIWQITIDIMLTLPEWFSPPDDIYDKAMLHREYPFFVAYDGDTAVGFLALKLHNRFTAEIFNLGVLKEYQRCGLGKMLLDAAESYCRGQGCTYLTVKTLDSSVNYPPYDQTRAFYDQNGFIPLGVFTTIWNPQNPCLFLVKGL